MSDLDAIHLQFEISLQFSPQFSVDLHFWSVWYILPSKLNNRKDQVLVVYIK